MNNKTTLKNGCCRTIEWEVRGIDKHGDADDVNHFTTLAGAQNYARATETEHTATVIERHTSFRPAHLAPGEPDVYAIVATSGDAEALAAWGV